MNGLAGRESLVTSRGARRIAEAAGLLPVVLIIVSAVWRLRRR
jgi:hypothetical protein